MIGGVIANADPRSALGRAYYFTEFNRWLPGTRAGFVDEIPTCCLSMKRSAFERHGPFIEGTHCSDTVFHWRMATAGQRPYLDPSLRVAHVSPSGLWRIISHVAFHGRSFARVRTNEHGLSRFERVLRALSAPLLPFVLFARAARNIARSGQQRLAFLSASPVVLLTMAAWSFGEARGYLARTAR